VRIAYILTSLGIGGADRQVVAIAERMAARGHDVALIVLRPRQEHEFAADVEAVRLGMSKSAIGVLGGLRRGRRFLSEFKPGIVHSHTFPGNMAARVLHLLGAAPVVISTIHNIYEGGWVRTQAYRLTDPLCRHITAVSEAVAIRCVQSGAVRRDKCSVITNGIDVKAFEPARGVKLPDSGSAHEQDAFIWLAAGRAVPAKDFNSLMAAFRLVRAEAPRAQLWIAGERGARQTEESNELGGVCRLGLCADMESVMGRADGFVLSSAWEGMPLVVGEAMAMERPVVATDVGGVRELVGDSGVLVPAKAPAALAEAMLRVMRMPEEDRREQGRSARARILTSFDINAKVREWEALYAELSHAGAHSAA
jgi:glycosyltransferase involved in cell wall biosynthesis